MLNTMRPRVLHVISSLDGGGAERVLLTVLAGLPDVEQALALGGPGSLVPLVPSHVPIFPFSSEPELAQVMADWRPDVVHTWLDGTLLTAIVPAAHLGLPVVHRLCNISSDFAEYGRLEPRHHDLMRRALGVTSAIVSLSTAAAEDAMRFYDVDRPLVIRNGFPLARVRPEFAADAPKPAGAKVILAVGRLSPEKGHRYLVEAVARLQGKHESLQLWIAGVGAEGDALRRHADAVGIGDRTKWLGFCEDVGSLHAAADVFAFPSLSEGFGNALAEAVIAGVPAVASDLPAIRSEVLGGSDGALLVPPGDVAALAQALDDLLSNPVQRHSLLLDARAARERLSVERMLSAYEALYGETAEVRRGAA